jgi:hypothetical protein
MRVHPKTDVTTRSRSRKSALRGEDPAWQGEKQQLRDFFWGQCNSFCSSRFFCSVMEITAYCSLLSYTVEFHLTEHHTV